MRGSCLCGDVVFEVREAYSRFYQCHCSLCRKQGGAASNSALLVNGADFHWLSGAGNLGTYVRPTGFRSDFCRRCGSPVPNPLRDTDIVWVPLGLLDDSPRLDPVAHLCLGSRAAWDTAPVTGQPFDAMPPLPALRALLQPDCRGGDADD